MKCPFKGWQKQNATVKNKTAASHVKGASCSFCRGSCLLGGRALQWLIFLCLNKLTSFSWLNQQTDLKGQLSVISFYLADAATFLASNRPYFLRTACVFRDGNWNLCYLIHIVNIKNLNLKGTHFTVQKDVWTWTWKCLPMCVCSLFDIPVCPIQTPPGWACSGVCSQMWSMSEKTQRKSLFQTRQEMICIHRSTNIFLMNSSCFSYAHFFWFLKKQMSSTLHSLTNIIRWDWKCQSKAPGEPWVIFCFLLQGQEWTFSHKS